MGAVSTANGSSDGEQPDGVNDSSGEQDTDAVRVRRVPTQPRALVTYESIVSAAAELVADRGVYGLAIADVTEAAGVSKGAFYGYFNGMDELSDELRSRARAEYVSYLGAFFSSGDFSTAAEALCEFAVWYAKFLRTNHLARSLFLERGRDIGIGPLDNEEWQIRRPWRSVLGYMDQAGLLSRPVDVDLEKRAEAMYCQFEALVDLAFRGDPQGDPGILELLDEMLTVQAPLL